MPFCLWCSAVAVVAAVGESSPRLALCVGAAAGAVRLFLLDPLGNGSPGCLAVSVRDIDPSAAVAKLLPGAFGPGAGFGALRPPTLIGCGVSVAGACATAVGGFCPLPLPLPGLGFLSPPPKKSLTPPAILASRPGLFSLPACAVCVGSALRFLGAFLPLLPACAVCVAVE